MRPIFKILADGTDVTSKINDRLLSLTLHDEDGINSDTAEIYLDNRDKVIAIPPKGAELHVYIGYADSGLVDKGLFTVDETNLAGPPHTLTIRAKAADMRKKMKEPRSASYDGITIGALVEEIAARHGLTPKVGSDLADVSLGHVDQTDESDLHLLTRLAQQYGAVAKPANECLVFVTKGEAKSASGKGLTAVTVDLSVDGGTYSYTAADRKNYGSATARWHDQAANKDRDVTVADDATAPAYTIRGSFPNEEAARAAAKARLAALKRGTVTLSLSNLIGKPTATAEAPLTVANAHAEVDAISWTIKETTHTLTDGGFTTQIEAEVKKR